MNLHNNALNMSKKKKGKRKAKKRSTPATTTQSQRLQQAAETRSAVAATVAWMLSLMSTITAEVLGLACRWYTVLVEPSDLLTVLSTVMLFVAVIAGGITLLLTPVVLRIAKTRPPQSVVQVAVFAGVLPLIAVALQQLKHFADAG